MGDPVQNKPVKVMTPDASAKRREGPFRCGKGEYIHINEDGRRVCLKQETLGILQSAGITCGEKEGGFPCNFGQERFGIPKKPPVSPPPSPPQDQFKPAEPKELARLITGRAEYDCKTQMPHAEHWMIHREVSVQAVPDEPEAKARARLEQAARDLAKTILGCQEIKFLRLQPSPKESAQAPTQFFPSPAFSRDYVMDAYNRICGPGGPWQNRPICRR